MKSNTFITDKDDYLQRLKTVAVTPKIVYTIGKLPSPLKHSVAIVGTRRPTAYGKRISFDFAYKLAQQGITIVSGLAYGIDAAAHKGALAAQGNTVAVLAHGLDSVYPANHTQLAHQIVEAGGSLISEYADGAPVMKHRFLERNRIISGLADAVLVIEAGEASGTTSTIQYALAQGKEVFAVPGPIDSPTSAGTNRLIQQGAHPALTAQDILTIIAPGQKIHNHPPTGDTPAETQILMLLYKGINDNQQLLTKSALTISIFAQTVTLLEIRGRIERTTGGQWSLIR